MSYIENPKTKGSGILCAIPQSGTCPNKCEGCFFQSGKSYLEPLAVNLPNMPSTHAARNHVVRVNDGNDSNVERAQVIADTEKYAMKFYNTAMACGLDKFPGPIVLTINPAPSTDKAFKKISDPPANLMFVRFRANTWNNYLCDDAVRFYTHRQVPVVLTFMAYDSADSIPERCREDYIERVRTINSYWAITTDAWQCTMSRYNGNKLVHSCGTIEGERGDSHCRYCGNCLREYFATMERIRACS
jgi:hypothetical protein